MSLKGKYALITGGSRGIGRGIALKLAESGVKIAIHYYKNADAANDTLAKVRERGSSGFIVQADVNAPEEIRQMMNQVKREFGALDFFVSNARPEIPGFYKPPLEINVEQWQLAINSQATAFLVGVQLAVPLMGNGGRIIAITHSPGARTGSWQPWVAMGSAKAALESLVRYFAVALVRRGITVNSVSPGVIFGAPNKVDGGVLISLPDEIQRAIKSWHESGWCPARRTGTPQDVANAVILICMEESSWMTGQIFNVDGGASIMDTVFPLEIQGAA
jgi:NAD(P)-dependent dehydrogenase (short-subunit alcohol dehydrogenase family)